MNGELQSDTTCDVYSEVLLNAAEQVRVYRIPAQVHSFMRKEVIVRCPRRSCSLLRVIASFNNFFLKEMTSTSNFSTQSSNCFEFLAFMLLQEE